MVQSWDTASKPGAHNDYSVCVTALVRKRTVFIDDIKRVKLDYPNLKKAIIKHAQDYGTDVILIEDSAAGTGLIQELKQDRNVKSPIAVKATQDKVSRAATCSSYIEAGDVLLRENTDWLADLRTELVQFPNGRHDDQIDAMAQLIN